jgi:transglutaminase-like putative cysteine protease
MSPSPAALAPTPLIDSHHPAVAAYAERHAVGEDDRSRAVALYYAVRDDFRYDPYRVDLSPDGMRASSVLHNGYGWCVPKAALLAAVCRAAGIPARLGYADVRNHLSTERMRRSMKTDLFIWHGYTDIWIDGAWRKATPAFNLSLCERFGLHPLEFNGHDDSIYHAFDKAGNKHMEYVNQRGAYDDMPLAQMVADFERFYGPGRIMGERMEDADFLADVEREHPDSLQPDGAGRSESCSTPTPQSAGSPIA